jgi:hypothetical protein
MLTYTRFLAMFWVLFFGSAAFADGGGGGTVGGGCRLPIGDFTLLFSAYQPQLSGDTRFCTELPNTGTTHLVFDYESLEGSTAQKNLLALDKKIKEMTIEVEVKKGDQSLFKRPPQKLKAGSIETVVDFPEAGEYTVEVKLTDPEGKTLENHLSLKVGTGGVALGTLLVIAVVIAAAVYMLYLSSAGFREKVQNLLAKGQK